MEKKKIEEITGRHQQQKHHAKVKTTGDHIFIFGGEQISRVKI